MVMLFLFAGCAAIVTEDADAGGSAQTVFTAHRLEETRASADPLADERENLPFFTTGKTEAAEPVESAEASTVAFGMTVASGANSIGEATDATKPSDPAERSVDAQAETPSTTSVHYVCNTNSKKFHLPSCGSVKTIKAANRSDYGGTREELLAKGYSPCKKCEP